MTPAERIPSEVQEPADSGAAGATDAPKQPRRGRRAAPKRPEAAAKPRPQEKSALVTWAYVEYQRLRQQGQAPDILQWCAQFPTCRSALRQVLEVEAFAASFLDRRRPSSGDASIDWPAVAEQRGDFTIIRELGRGAFARVYLATEASTGGRLVVLKCSLRGDAEARTMGRLAHPYIVPILSARLDESSGLTLVCMPYQGSATLEDVLDHLVAAEVPPRKASFLLDVLRFRAQPEDRPLTPDRCLLHGSYTDGVIHLAAQLAETLAFLHQNGVCHRDLKPSNVLLDPSGKPRLLDFNLSESERESIAPVGGTLRYMAPEQLRAFQDQSKASLDKRVDFYALGVMVYELLGGVHPCSLLLAEPFQPSQAQAMLEALNAGFQPFREICPELERPVAAVLDRCLALDASDRPANAEELVAALKRQFTRARRLRRRLSSHRRWLVGTLCLLLVATGIGTYVWAVTPPYSEREYERGRIAFYAGDYSAAEMHFHRAFRADMTNDRYRHARGWARFQLSKYSALDEARIEDILDDLTFTKSGPADPITLAVHAYMDQRRGRVKMALQKYNYISRRFDDYRPMMILNNRAQCYMTNNDWDKAQSDLDLAVKLRPPHQAVHYNRVLIAKQRLNQGDTPNIPQEALDDLELALRLGPNTSVLCREAAIVYALAANKDPRHPLFERALLFLRQAITAGEDPIHFGGIAPLKEALKRPEFVTLLRSPRPEASSRPGLGLIDPIEDLPDH
ncbi:MAG TPA: serine/threonine-protein kinase [Gemmataceae bacterium]|jgi:serine/threonine protein kinase